MNEKRQMPPPQQGRIQVPMTEAVPEACDKCGNEYFRIVYKIMTLSPLAGSNPTGQKVTHDFGVFQCIHCQTIWNPNKKKMT